MKWKRGILPLFCLVAVCTVFTLLSRSPPVVHKSKNIDKVPFVASQKVKDFLKLKETKKEILECNNRRKWRNIKDTPEPIGFKTRPDPMSRAREDLALTDMWKDLDAQTRAKNSQSINARPKTPEEIATVWGKSMKDFDERMKEISEYSADMLQNIKDIRQDLLCEIAETQNPPDCSTAKYLFVENDKNNYGLGAQLHHFIYTLMVGYASGRVVVIEKNNFKYSATMKKFCGNDTSIECFFQPLGKCSHYLSDSEGKKAALWIPGDETNDQQFLRLRCRSSVEYRDWVPKALKQELIKFHERPLLWWVGHFTHYFLRPSNKVNKGFLEMKKYIGFSKPIMGMHVRGKEKASEAPVHALQDYMPYARYPTIYIATDDQDNVDATSRLKNHTWLMVKDPQTGRLSGVGERHDENAILNLLYDVYFLADSDFFIGTDSSQISRAIYELMQVKHPDATRLGVSLDTILTDRKFEFYWFLI